MLPYKTDIERHHTNIETSLLANEYTDEDRKRQLDTLCYICAGVTLEQPRESLIDIDDDGDMVVSRCVRLYKYNGDELEWVDVNVGLERYVDGTLTTNQYVYIESLNSLIFIGIQSDSTQNPNYETFRKIEEDKYDPNNSNSSENSSSNSVDGLGDHCFMLNITHPGSLETTCLDPLPTAKQHF